MPRYASGASYRVVNIRTFTTQSGFVINAVTMPNEMGWTSVENKWGIGSGDHKKKGLKVASADANKYFPESFPLIFRHTMLDHGITEK
jgi:hypothetical protein